MLRNHRRYHWAFLVGPKIENAEQVRGVRYHAVNPYDTGWKFEKTDLSNVRMTHNLLARILIGKIENLERLNTILENVPVTRDDPQWRCRNWIASSLTAIKKDGKAVGTAQLDWNQIEETARRYVAEKTAMGRYQKAENILGPRPTWDMLDGKETVA